MIIDCHVHIGKLAWFHMDADADELIRAADRAGIDRLMVTDGTALTYDMEAGNEALRREIAKYPDRLYAYYTVPSAHYGPKAAEELERYVCEYGFRGLKIYSVPPPQVIDDASMIPVLEKAAELKIPVLAHSTGAECESLSRQVPEVILINAHMGCCPQANGDWHRSIAAAKRVPEHLPRYHEFVLRQRHDRIRGFGDRRGKNPLRFRLAASRSDPSDRKGDGE